jgi:hypothetical protein
MAGQHNGPLASKWAGEASVGVVRVMPESLSTSTIAPAATSITSC